MGVQISFLLGNKVGSQIDLGENWKVSNIGLQYNQPLTANTEVISGIRYAPRIICRTNIKVEIPETFAFGWTCHRLNQWTIGMDWEYRPHQTKVSLGRIYSSITLPCRRYYRQTNITTGNGEYGLSTGLRMLTRDKRSFIHLTAESVWEKDYPQKRHYRLILSYTFNEQWFYKRKLQ